MSTARIARMNFEGALRVCTVHGTDETMEVSMFIWRISLRRKSRRTYSTASAIYRQQGDINMIMELTVAQLTLATKWNKHIFFYNHKL